MKRVTRVPVLVIVCLMSICASLMFSSTAGYAQVHTPQEEHNDGHRIVGYFTQWGIYSGYFVKNLVTSGSAAKMSVVNYAFGNISTNLQCFDAHQAGVGDACAD